ncbi:MAG: MarR family transcriptional regulator, partial [Pseudomonadota bacterium]
KRLSKVFLTEEGREWIKLVDRAWKRLEKEAVSGLDTKDRKRLRKLLRQIEKNLSASDQGLESDEDLDLDGDQDTDADRAPEPEAAE